MLWLGLSKKDGSFRDEKIGPLSLAACGPIEFRAIIILTL